MSNIIDLVSYRAELQRKVEAIDLLLGGSTGNGASPASHKTNAPAKRRISAAGRARIAAAARGRWATVKGAVRVNKIGPTTNEVILKALASRKDVATRVIKAACVKAG